MSWDGWVAAVCGFEVLVRTRARVQILTQLEWSRNLWFNLARFSPVLKDLSSFTGDMNLCYSNPSPCSHLAFQMLSSLRDSCLLCFNSPVFCVLIHLSLAACFPQDRLPRQPHSEILPAYLSPEEMPSWECSLFHGVLTCIKWRGIYFNKAKNISCLSLQLLITILRQKSLDILKL